MLPLYEFGSPNGAIRTLVLPLGSNTLAIAVLALLENVNGDGRDVVNPLGCQYRIYLLFGCSRVCGLL